MEKKIKCEKKRVLKQYVIVSHYEVMIQPFYSLEEADDFAFSHMGASGSPNGYFVSEMKHFNMNARLNLK